VAVRKTAARPFDADKLAVQYEQWYSRSGRRADRLEKRLLGEWIASFAGAATVLEIGCGTGHFTRWMAQQRLQAVGLDISPAMLTEAQRWNGCLI
jgi:ubiquinone/menaquinone biosynthesis C-methylase UbiE